MTQKRRGSGEGSIRQRADGRWEGRIEAGWSATGARRRASVFGRTRLEVVGKLRQLQAQRAAGLPVVDGRTTVGSYLNRWLETVQPRVRPATHVRYKGIVTGQLVPSIGRIRLAALQPQQVAGMLAQLQRDGLAPRTVHHARAVLRTALSDAERLGVVTRNVAKLTEAPRVPSPAPRVLSPAEARAVLEAMSDPELRRLATVAVNTGLRQGELLGLRWSDVDLRAPELHVTMALQRLGGETRLVETKSRTSRRTVPLTADAVEALSQERRVQLEARLAAGGRWTEPIPGLVFTTATGAPRSPSAVTHQFAESLAAAGIPHLRWHDLRAAFGGLMLASGSDLATVSSLLGHSSIAITASTYAGVLPSLKKDAAQRFERLMRGPV